MQNWLVDILGGIMNGLALVFIAIWAAVYARESESTPDEKRTKAKKGRASASKTRSSIVLLTGVIIFAVGATFFQILSAFQRHSTDTQLVRYYDDQFRNMTQRRMLAAKALEEYMQKKQWKLVTNNIDGLDEVLGFFDALGSEVKHGAISQEVAYEYFQADIAPYYQASEEYIAECQTNEGDSAGTYEFVKPLYEVVQTIEAGKAHRTVKELRLSDSALKAYLDSEINSPNLKDAK